MGHRTSRAINLTAVVIRRPRRWLDATDPRPMAADKGRLSRVARCSPMERGTGPHVAINWGKSPGSARPLAWARSENDTLMPMADALAARRRCTIPDSRDSILTYARGEVGAVLDVSENRV